MQIPISLNLLSLTLRLNPFYRLKVWVEKKTIQIERLDFLVKTVVGGVILQNSSVGFSSPFEDTVSIFSKPLPLLVFVKLYFRSKKLLISKAIVESVSERRHVQESVTVAAGPWNV